MTTSRGADAISFLNDLTSLRQIADVTTRNGKPIALEEGLGLALGRFEKACLSGRKIMFVGNGGSAAIASHMAVDYTKAGGLRALAFNDSSFLTCFGNDLGYENVFAEPIRHFAQKGDIVVAISSAGRSPNILRGAVAGRKAGCGVITLSGFAANNPLRKLGDLNLYVSSDSYGIVEVSHLSLLHSILDERVRTRAS